MEELTLLQADPDLWRKWVAKLDDKGFFKDAVVGSEEHKTRTLKALAKFKEKFGDVKPAAVRTPVKLLHSGDLQCLMPLVCIAQPALSKQEREAKAEEIKGKGRNCIAC